MSVVQQVQLIHVIKQRCWCVTYSWACVCVWLTQPYEEMGCNGCNCPLIDIRVLVLQQREAEEV